MYKWKLAGAIVLASFAFSMLGFGQTPEVQLLDGNLNVKIANADLQKQLENGTLKPSEFVQVFTKNPETHSGQPAILGDFAYANNAIQFQPLLPFQQGATYFVVFQKESITRISIPQAKSDPPSVKAIYPSADTLPANLLKFYFHFDRPMSAGRTYDHVTLIKNGTDTLFMPFVQLQPELWNYDKTRLTLWLDPGRIKRDLNPNRQYGAVLHSGNQYEMIIDGEWEDQNGQPFGKSHSKLFFVNMEDRVKPNVAGWKILPPENGTTRPLRIHFDEPMDHALASGSIEVYYDNEAIQGTVKLEQQEQVWLFTPGNPWKNGTYHLRIDAKLEDQAGNNLNRLFDVDLADEEQQVKDRKFYSRTFEVK